MISRVGRQRGSVPRRRLARQASSSPFWEWDRSVIALLLSGDGTITAESSSRAQLPLLLAQASNLSTVAVGQASETDTALPITLLLSGVAIVQVGIATETDTALVITIDQPPVLILPVGQATETDTALSINASVEAVAQFVAVGIASETDTALPVSFFRTFLLSHSDNDLSLSVVDVSELSLTPVEVE